MRRRTFLWWVWLACAAVCWADSRSDPALGARVVEAARRQIGVTTEYDPRYVSLAYPGGDVPPRTGVCSDVVVRALRGVGVDLQREIHEDMTAHFSAYPQRWGLKKPDPNIDHRRVANLMTYFQRKQISLAEKWTDPASYAPGDIVAWDLGNGQLHVGVVSERMVRGERMVIHNIGAGAREESVLFTFRVIGHYRLKEARAALAP